MRISNLFHNVVFQTVISGTLVLIAGQVIQRFILEPISELKKVIGKIDYQIKYYNNIICNAGLREEVYSECSKMLRALSCELESIFKQIPFKLIFDKLTIIPCKKNISEASKILIFLSNSLNQSRTEEKNYDKIQELRKYLNIEELKNTSSQNILKIGLFKKLKKWFQ